MEELEMAEHTSGPWQLHSPTEGDPITGDGSYCITGPGGGVIADIVPKDWHETPANARLIVVAPDLFDSVLELLDVAQSSHSDCDWESDTDCGAEQYGDGNPDEHLILRGAEATIDKATGREVSDG